MTAVDDREHGTRAGAAAPRCAVCGAGMRFAFADDEARYHLCPTCDYLTPVVPDLDPRGLNDAIYIEKFDNNRVEAGVVDPKRRRKYGRFLARVAPYRQLNRLLDIGCGAGRLLRVTAEAGWQAYGVDPAMEQLSRETPEGITIVPRLLVDAGFAPGFFDVVHANEVFEHVEDPARLVEEIKAVLRPGGLLVFRTPNHRSWTAGAVGPRWREFGLHGKGHVGFFSPASARALLARAGFRQVDIETHHFSLRDRWRDDVPIVGPALRLGYKLVGQVARLFDRGERMTVHARLGDGPAGATDGG
ncbi:MAG: class I SAM-dependent methyltransferase [Planctomycetota bacterium]